MDTRRMIPTHEDPDVHTFLRGTPRAQVAWLVERGLPPAVLLPVQNACAQRCVFCAGPGTSELPSAANTPGGALSAHLQARPAGVTRLLIGGNEPTLHSAFESLLREAGDVGFTRVDLLTNGVALAENAGRWAASGLSEVVVPLYAADAAEHDAIAGVVCYDRVVRGLDAAYAAGIRVRLHTLALAPTLRHLPDLAAMSLRRYGDRLHVGLLRAKPGFEWSSLAPALADVRSVLRTLDAGLVGAPPCLRWGEGPGVFPAHPGFTRVVDRPALLAELYFRTQARGFDPACSGCPARTACPGLVRAWLEGLDPTRGENSSSS